MADQPNSVGGPPPIHEAAKVTPIERGMIDRMISGVRSLFSPLRPPAVEGTNQGPWFGPGQPQTPVAPKEDVAGRAFDFPVGINTYARPRAHEPVTFAQLRALADPTTGWDLLRLALETRKDQMAKLEWSILPRKKPNQSFRDKPDDNCREIERFFRKPDKIHSWQDWVRLLMEEQLVIDAPAIYCRKTNDGKPYALEVISGDTIQPLLDGTGRRPIPPDPAYQQVLKGVVAASYTAEELMYVPRNPRTNKVYGMSPVEQIIMTINVGLRRQVTQLEHYTSGNVPEALIGVPENWAPQQIAEYQRYWDSYMESAAQRRKAKFVPGKLIFQPTRNESGMMDQFDEWLARVVCYALSLPPLPFVRMMNRATAQTSYESALEEGLQPNMVWLKNMIDDMIADWFCQPDYEIVWDSIRKLDAGDQAMQNLQFMQRGIKSLDEVRAEMGLEPLGLQHVVYGVGPLGFMSPKAMQRCMEMGLDMPQQPMMAPEGVDPMTGEPTPGMEEAEPGADLLAGVPPELLASVGLTPDGRMAEEDAENEQDSDLTDDDEDFGAEDLPEDQGQVAVRGAVHPEVAAALTDAERRLGVR